MKPTRPAAEPLACADGNVVGLGVRRLAWATLAATVGVILGGAVVRATESGAGCGESWPRCDGSLIPVSPGAATVIEFTHRLMSASLGLLLLALGIALVRRRVRSSGHGGLGHGLRTTAATAILPLRRADKGPMEKAFGWAVLFFVGEVFIGAALVLFGWVDQDASFGRAIAVSVHLVNTFLLLGALTLVAHFATSGDVSLRRDELIRRTVLLGVLAMLVVGASGALNALADTLFPADSVVEGIRDEFGPTAPLLLQLRVVHPVVAIVGGGVVFLLAQSPQLRLVHVDSLRRAVISVVGVQFVVGLVNVALLTPLSTQVLHLLLADVLWILWVLLGARALLPTEVSPPVAAGEPR